MSKAYNANVYIFCFYLEFRVKLSLESCTENFTKLVSPHLIEPLVRLEPVEVDPPEPHQVEVLLPVHRVHLQLQ